MTEFREIGEPEDHPYPCWCVICEEQYAPPVEDPDD